MLDDLGIELLEVRFEVSAVEGVKSALERLDVLLRHRLVLKPAAHPRSHGASDRTLVELQTRAVRLRDPDSGELDRLHHTPRFLQEHIHLLRGEGVVERHGPSCRDGARPHDRVVRRICRRRSSDGTDESGSDHQRRRSDANPSLHQRTPSPCFVPLSESGGVYAARPGPATPKTAVSRSAALHVKQRFPPKQHCPERPLRSTLRTHSACEMAELEEGEGVSVRIRKRLSDAARAFSATAHNRDLRRAQLSYGATWTAEWAFTVALGVVAFR